MNTESNHCRSNENTRGSKPSRVRLRGLGLLAIAALAGCSGESFSLAETGVDDGAASGSAAGSGGAGGSGVVGSGSGGDVGHPIPKTVVEVVGSDGQAMEGVDVVVNDADGALQGHTTTGADGRALVDVPPLGSVSALGKYSKSSGGMVFTVRNIRTAVDPSEDGTYRVMLPTAANEPPENSAMAKLTLTPAIQWSATLSATLSCKYDNPVNVSSDGKVVYGYTGCAGESTYDVFMFATGGYGFINYAVLLDQPLLPGAVVHHTMDFGPIGKPIVLTTSQVMPLPPGSLEVGMSLSGYRAGRASAVVNEKHITAPSASGASRVLWLPDGIFSKYRLEEVVLLQKVPIRRSASHSREAEALPESSTWSSTTLATVDALSKPDLTTVAQPVLQWSLSETGLRGDWIEASQTWRRGDSEDTTWMVVEKPASEGAARFPELPEELSEYRLKAGDVLGSTLVDHVDVADVEGFLDYLDGYDTHSETTRNAASRPAD